MSFFVSKSLEGLIDEETLCQDENFDSKSSYRSKALLTFSDEKNNKIFFNVNEIHFNPNDVMIVIETHLKLLELLNFKKLSVNSLIFKDNSIELKNYTLNKAIFSININEYLAELSCSC